MIRRDAMVAASPGRAAESCWLLISQQDHAKISGDLADAWQFSLPADTWQFSLPADVVRSLRIAARHHDDGWPEWDTRPDVDVWTGLPRAFNEMRVADSLAIWRRSIECSAGIDPFAGYLVAGHFLRLLERFDSWRSTAAGTELVEAFVAEQRTHQAAWLRSWQQGRRDHSLQRAEQCVAWLQLFDAISLWLCCEERNEPWKTAAINGQAWIFSPAAGPGAKRIVVAPWPFTPREVTLSVPGSCIAGTKYPTTEVLAATPASSTTLHWQLVPG